MRKILPLSAGFAFAAVAATQGTPSFQWRVTDAYGISSCRMVFDLARNRFVAQGALGAAQTDLTVEWDGSRWETRRTSSAPSARAGFGLAYDFNRSRVVLFGGSLDGSNTTAQLQNDLWEYDGVDWEARNPVVRPPARQQLAMTWDFFGGRVLMTGGSTEASPALTDTWAWNGNAWQQLAATSPPLAHPEMAPHLSTQRVVLVGSRNGSGETWTFDGTNWNQVAAAVPLAPSYRMATDIANDRVVLLVGDQSTVLEWNGSNWATRGPSDGRRDCGLAADGGGHVLAFAGTLLGPLGLFGQLLPLKDTWALDPGGATRLADGGPRDELELHVAYDLLRNRIVGVGAIGTTVLAATWEHDGLAWHAGAAPAPTVPLGTRLCHDLLRGRTVRFGGYRATPFSVMPTDELSEWDGVQWQVMTTPGPAPRFNHALAYDLTHAVVLLFGGMGQGSVSLGDTWQWDGTNWTLRTSTGPASRSQAAMTFDVARSRAVLFGGVLASGGTAQPAGDTWEWDGVSWLQRTPAVGPQPRYDAIVGYDMAHQRTILLGGYNANVQLSDMWTWDGSSWTQVPGSLPASNGRRVGAFRGDGSIALVTSSTTWTGAAPLATVDVVGAACGAATLPALRTHGVPVTGTNAFAVELHRAGANAPFLLAIGVGTASTPIGAGCTVYLPQIDESRVAFAGPSGYAEVPLPVPNAPQLIGLEVSLQAGALDATAPLGFALSNGVVARVGY